MYLYWIVAFFVVFVANLNAAMTTTDNLQIGGNGCNTSGSSYTGTCTITGSGIGYLDKPLNVDTLILSANGALPQKVVVLRLPERGSNSIKHLIIQRQNGIKDAIGKEVPFRLDFDLGGSSNTTLVIDNITGSGNNPMNVVFGANGMTLTYPATGGVKVTQPNGTTISPTNPSGGSNNGNTGGNFNVPPEATQEQIQNAAYGYAIALKEQLVRESTNTMILYNILNNYDGTYMSYDYGLSHQFSMGAFNNGGFFRYYNQNSNNGFDIGAKSKLRVANRFYLRSALYYSYIDFGKALDTKFATHSIIAGIGLLKEFDFALGGSGNVFFVLNPSVNAYYAATLKGKYIPTNHLVFGNIALDTGVKIKKNKPFASRKCRRCI